MGVLSIVEEGMDILPITAYRELGVLPIVAQGNGCFTHNSIGNWVFYP